MHKHILVPVDLMNTEPAKTAIEVARGIARREGARISVLSVVPTWSDDMSARTPKDRQPELDAFIAGVADGADIEGRVAMGGSISGRIIEAVMKRGIDLVVMASHDPRMTDYLIGSNAAHVVLHAPCSVLVVRGPVGFRNILVPVDLDRPKSALKALETARDMAAAAGGKATVVSVQPMRVDESGRQAENYQPRMDAFLSKHGKGIEGFLRRGGSISAEIRWAADEIEADVIVMASHDPHFTDYLVGSNAAHVVLHSRRSVMVVR